MAQQKAGFIGGRINGPLRIRLTRINERFGPSDTVMLEDALSALANYVERHGKYERPMRMDLDRGGLVEIPGMVAEAQGTYGVPAPEHVRNPKQPARSTAKRA